jgi:hypothetical protein
MDYIQGGQAITHHAGSVRIGKHLIYEYLYKEEIFEMPLLVRGHKGLNCHELRLKIKLHCQVATY